MGVKDFDNGELTEMLAFVSDLASSAGQIIAHAIKANKQVMNKSQRDFVTDTDEKCEGIILDALKKKYPTHKFIGEEETAKAGALPDLTDEPTWFCDPLDGTTNFVHGFPFVCVSIGLTLKKQPVLGVVHAPILEETFTAAKGLGALRNGSKISTSGETQILQSLVITELGPDRSPSTLDTWIGRYRSVAERCRSMRFAIFHRIEGSIGSCAIGMASVACGRADAMYEVGFGGPWDCVAGAALVTEAGGCVFDPSGKPFSVMSRRVACSASSALERALAETLAPNSSNPSEPEYFA